VTSHLPHPPEDEWPSVDRRKPGWALDWQSALERERGELARTLHDDTGGLLVAAVMDIRWVETRIEGDALGLRKRLERALRTLDQVIDLNRAIIEELRPTLLENFGLVAALKWLCTKVCTAAGTRCEQRYAEPSPLFSPTAAISIYRMTETLLGVVTTSGARTAFVSLLPGARGITLAIGAGGLPTTFSREEHIDALGSVTARVRALGGEMQIEQPPNEVSIMCQLPASQVLAKD
jgi:signal transduction histidine kinase